MMEKYIFLRTIRDCFWYYKEMMKHKIFVSWYTLKICWKLLWRSFVHDLEKFKITEFIALRNVIPLGRRMREVEYGSPEHVELTRRIKEINGTHYWNSSHHPEFYDNGFFDMSFLDRLEMVIDWKAATKRNKNGDVVLSIKNNQDKYKYSDADKEWMLKISEEIS